MSFFNKLMGSDDDKRIRTLEHPKDLKIGDMIEFELMDQQNLANRTFQVSDIWTLNYSSDTHFKTYFEVNDIDEKIRLNVQKEQIEVAMQVYPETLLEFFEEDDIAVILDPDSGVNHQLKSNIKMKKVPPELQGWVTKKYRQEGFEIAYRYSGDYRNKSLPEHRDSGEIECDYAWLVSDDRQFSLEFRVFDGGRTEVHFCAMIPLRKITGLWPKQSDLKQEENSGDF